MKRLSLDDQIGLRSMVSGNVWNDMSRFLKSRGEQLQCKQLMNPLTMHAGHSMDCKAKLNAKMNEYALEYEAGVWTSAAEKKVSFVRMASMHNGAQEFASRMHAKGLTCWHLNLQQDEYRVQVQFDKGGASTKVTMHSYNLKEKNSIRNSYLIGIYEGDKDDRETIRAIFGGSGLCSGERERCRVGDGLAPPTVFLILEGVRGASPPPPYPIVQLCYFSPK